MATISQQIAEMRERQATTDAALGEILSLLTSQAQASPTKATTKATAPTKEATPKPTPAEKIATIRTRTVEKGIWTGSTSAGAVASEIGKVEVIVRPDATKAERKALRDALEAAAKAAGL